MTEEPLLPHGIYHSNPPPGRIIVISFGIIRSGSTFVYQILTDIFQAGVVKTHRFVQGRGPAICTYRDLRDCVVSYLRTRYPNHKKFDRTLVDEGIKQVNKSYDAFILYRSSRKSLAELQYESFIKNPHLIFNAISMILAISRTKKQIKESLEKHSMEENRKIASQFSGHQEFDPYSRIHGDHVHEGEIGTWRRFVEDHDHINKMLKPGLERLGYET
jgi:hypothetical protein